jgi:putative transcriptional regulator
MKRSIKIHGHFITVLSMLVLGLGFLFGPGQNSGLADKKPVPESALYFPGQLLIASPKIADPRFRKTVIFMVKHNAEGAHGLIVNKIFGRRKIAKLMKNFGLKPQGATGSLNLHLGGPVRRRGVFILHTSDYESTSSHLVDGTISFTTDVGILQDIAQGNSPRKVLIALGYAGWGAGQLGDEVARGDWSLAKATEEIVFGGGRNEVWERIVGSSELPL